LLGKGVKEAMALKQQQQEASASTSRQRISPGLQLDDKEEGFDV